MRDRLVAAKAPAIVVVLILVLVGPRTGRGGLSRSSDYESALDHNLLQLIKESFKRILGNTLADRIVCNSDRAFEIGCGVISKYCAIRLVYDADLTGGVD